MIGTNAHLALRDAFTAGNLGRTDTTSPALPTDVVGLANGNFGYTSIDMAADPDCVATPEIVVEGNGNSITSGDTIPGSADNTNFGTANSGTPSVDRVFTVRNTGTAPLSIIMPPLSGADAAQFSVAVSIGGVLSPGASVPFTLRYDPQAVGTHTALVSLTTNDPDENPFTFAIRGERINTAPSALPGANFMVNSGDTANLDGSASTDLDPFHTLTFSWTQVSGPAVTLAGATTATPSFIAPNVAIPQVVVLRLTVSDGLASSSATVGVTIDPIPAPEIVVEGNGNDIADGLATGQVAIGTHFGTTSVASTDFEDRTFTIRNTGTAPLTLGAISFTGAAAADYAVTSAPSSPVAPGGSTTMTVRFQASALSTRDATLNIVTNDADENPFNFGIRGDGSNIRPDSDAGPNQIVTAGDLVTLDGSGSDANDVGQTLTYAWTHVSGPIGALSNASAQSPTFTAPAVASQQVSIWQLVVNDGVRDSFADTVSITINPGTPDITVTGNATPITTGDTTRSLSDHTDFGSILASSGSINRVFSMGNDGLGPLTYSSVTLTGPDAGQFSITTTTPGTQAPGSAAGVGFAYTPNSRGTHSATVQIVTDDPDESPFTFAIRGTATNTAPTVNAGPDQTVASGAAVTLDGSASNANDAGQTLGFNWAQASGPAVTLTGATTASPSFTAPTLIAGAPDAVIVNELTGNDGVDSDVDTVQITVEAPPNTTPTADAGADATVTSGDVVTLDGSGSDANDVGQALTYAWTLVSGPTATLSDATAQSPTFAAPAVATQQVSVWQLIVNDGVANSAADQVSITINPIPTPEIVIEGNSYSISDGDSSPSLADHTDFGSVVAVGAGAQDRTFTVRNAGAASLTYGTPSLSGPDAAQFALSSGTGSTLAAGASATFTIRYSPSAVGLHTATVTLTNNDADENPFTFAISGTGSNTAPTLSIGDADLVLSFDLTVSDGFTTATDSVQITVTAPVDTTPPTVSLSGAPSTISGNVSFTLTVTFSEPVTGFSASDLAVVNGRVTSVSGSGAVYSATITPSGTGDLSISVPRNGAADGAGNGNVASGSVTVADTTVADTQEQISGFMQSRMRQLVGQQPDLIALFRGEGGGHLNVTASRGNGSLSFATRPDWPIRAQMNATWSEMGASRSRYAHFAAGRHFAVTPTLSFGGMVQIDHIEHSQGVGPVEGTGWLLGGYVVGRHSEQPLYFSARALFGETRDSVSPFGTYTDQFSTTRGLIGATVAGDFEWRGTTWTPSLRAMHTMDRQRAYTDGLGNTVPEQSVAMSELALGLNTSTPIAVSRGALTLRTGITLAYSRTRGTGAAAQVIAPANGFSGGLRFGVDYLSEAGGQWRFDMNYDGLGQSSYQSLGIGLNYSRRF